MLLVVVYNANALIELHELCDAITSTIYFTLFEFHSYDRERGVWHFYSFIFVVMMVLLDIKKSAIIVY